MNIKYKNNKSKAITLVELVLSILLLSLVLVSVGSFVRYSFTVSGMQYDEFNFQSDMRDAVRLMDEKIKRSFVVYAIPKGDFLGDSTTVELAKHYDNLNIKWKYIGVDPVKTFSDGSNNPFYGHICSFVYNTESDAWEQKLLSSGNESIYFDIEFKKSSNPGIGQRLLSYTVSGSPVKDGNPDTSQKRNIDTQTKILDSFYVGDYGTATDKSIALAFIDEKEDLPHGSITFVIDGSDGMSYPMVWLGGSSTVKYVVVQNAIKEMVDNLGESSNLYVSLVGFAKFAYKIPLGTNVDGSRIYFLENNKDTTSNRDVIKEALELISPDSGRTYIVDGFLVDMEKAFNKGTNIGDGLRLAYNNIKYLIESKSSSNPDFGDLNINGPHYLILLTDALANKRTKNDKYYHGDNNYYGDVDPFELSGYDETNNTNLPHFSRGLFVNGGLGMYYKLDGKNMYLHRPIDLHDDNDKDTGYAIDVADHFNEDNVVNIGGFPRRIPNMNSYVVFTPTMPFIDWIVGQEDKINDLNDAVGRGRPYYYADDGEQLKNVLKEIGTEISKNFWAMNGPRH